MTAATVLTLSNGKGLDLLNPRAEDIDFAVIAEHLAKENRYNGATKNRCYSVAEHSVRCAMAALNACGDRRLAAYLLLCRPKDCSRCTRCSRGCPIRRTSVRSAKRGCCG